MPGDGVGIGGVSWQLWLAVVLVVFVAGCGGMTEPADSAAETETPTSTPAGSIDHELLFEHESFEEVDRAVEIDPDASADAVLEAYVADLQQGDVRVQDAGYFNDGASAGLVYESVHEPEAELRAVAALFAAYVNAADWDVTELQVMSVDVAGEPEARYGVDVAVVEAFLDGDLTYDEYLAAVLETVESQRGGSTPTATPTPDDDGDGFTWGDGDGSTPTPTPTDDATGPDREPTPTPTPTPSDDDGITLPGTT